MAVRLFEARSSRWSDMLDAFVHSGPLFKTQFASAGSPARAFRRGEICGIGRLLHCDHVRHRARSLQLGRAVQKEEASGSVTRSEEREVCFRRFPVLSRHDSWHNYVHDNSRGDEHDALRSD